VNTPSQPFTVQAITSLAGIPNPNFTPTTAVTVTPQLWDLNTNALTPARVPTQVPSANGGSAAVFSPAALTITAANPSQSFRLLSFPNSNPFPDPTVPATTCAGACGLYVVYFPDPNGLAAAGAASAGTPNPVWELPYFAVNIIAAEVSIPNFPPTNRVFFVAPAVTGSAPSNALTTGSYNYQIRIRRNPQDLSASPLLISTVVIPRGTGGTGAGAAPLFINGVSNYQFSFSGTNTTANFVVTTQGFPTPTGISFDIEFAVQPLAQFSNSLDVSGLGTSCVGLGTLCTLCNDNIAAGRLTCNGQRNVLLQGLTIRENPIETRINFPGPVGAANRAAPFVGEPFFFDFVWMPPLATGMTISITTAEVTSTAGTFTAAGANVQVAVPAGATSARAGPFTPLPPTNTPPTDESFSLAYSFNLAATGDSAWFGFNIDGVRNANVMTVVIYRRYLVSSSLARTAAGLGITLSLASTGVPSPQICLSLNLPLASPPYTNAPSDYRLTATPIAFVAGAAGTSATRWNGLIFTPNILQFSPGVQTQCMTVAYDTKFRLTTNALSDGSAAPTWNWDVTWQLGGGLKEQFVNPWYCTQGTSAVAAAFPAPACAGARIVNFPTAFALVRNPIQMWFLEGQQTDGSTPGQGLGVIGGAAAGTNGWFVGESRTLAVTTDWPTPNGITYNLYAPGLVFSSNSTNCVSNTNSCSFSGGANGAGSQTQQTHYWTVTAAITGPTAIIPGWTQFGASDPDNFKTGVSLEVSGADSALYNLPPNIDVFIRIRRVFVDQWVTQPITIAQGSSFSFNVRLGEPVLRALSVTPVVSNGNSGALTFTPSSVSFVPGGPSVATFSFTGNLLSGRRAGALQPWGVRFILGDQDRLLFWITNPSGLAGLDNTVNVLHRPAPTITAVDTLTAAVAGTPNILYPYVWYGPLKVSLAAPLATGEQLILNFASSDWSFSTSGAPTTSLTFTAGESFEFFSARPLVSGVTRIFFTLSGTDAWKFASPAAYTSPFAIAAVAPAVAATLTDATGANVAASVADTALVLGRHTYFVTRRPVTVQLEAEGSAADGVTRTSVVIGTTHYGQVLVQYPTNTLTITPVVRTSSATVVWSPPAPWTLDNLTIGTAFPFSYTVVSINQYESGPGNPTAGTPANLPQTTLGAANSINVAFTLGPSGSTEAAIHVATGVTINVLRRSFVWDVQGGAGAVAGGNPAAADASNNVATTATNGISNLGSQIFNNHFVVGRRSQLFTIAVSSPPTGPAANLTLRIAHPLLTFSPALLTWNQNDISKSFTFVPNALPPTGDWVKNFEIVVSGTDAQYYDYSALWNALKEIQILPNLQFTPIPVTYIDNDVVGMSVQLSDGLATGQYPYGDANAFTLHMYSPAIGGISFEPSALTFSASSPLSQSYVIHHTYPNLVDSAIGIAHPNALHATGASTDSYNIGWSIKFVGTNTFIPITRSIVPQEAQRVVVARYQIIPSFPQTLAYAWQPAYFNLTRAPLAHLTLVPHQPDRDGANGVSGINGLPTKASSLLAAAAVSANGVRYSSAAAAGKIVTEPPAIVFNPGQTVSYFQVRAIGYNPSQSYYRLDWQLSGHKDDRVCYVESGDLSPAQNGPYTFSTYHVASSHIATIGLLVSLVVMLALLL